MFGDEEAKYQKVANVEEKKVEEKVEEKKVDIPDEKTLKVFCGIEYRYSWRVLKQHPNFCATKYFSDHPDKNEVYIVDCCPDIYVYVNSFIVYGIKINPEFASRRVHYTTSDMKMCIRRFYKGNDIYR
jgi:hypothetical protein